MVARRKEGFFTKVDPVLVEAMKTVHAETGLSLAAQIDQALRAWLRARPEICPVPAERVAARGTRRTRKGVTTRKRRR